MPKIVKITTFLNPLDLIMPHSCRGCGALGSVLCERCKKHNTLCNFNICPNCRKQKTGVKCKTCKNLPPAYVVGAREGVLAGLIHDYKYNSVRAIKVVLAELMAEKLPDLENAALVPLPTSTRHIRERGFDHTLKLAKRIAKLKGWPVEQMLVREKNTVQVGADKKTRLKQADAAYAINPKRQIEKERTYVLLDDVWTTGASMKAAIKKLREAGASKIVVAVLSVSEMD